MKFSICLPTGFEGVMYPIPFVEPGDFVRMAQLCERLGYHSVWGNDHIQSQHYVRDLFPDSPPNFYELMSVLSFCAAATTTLEVGTALAVLPMRDPFWLAKQSATIDQLSNGRLILALGIGAYREEFAAWAPRLAPKAQRGEMMDEGIALMQRLFSERRVTHEGKYYAVRDIEMYPKPKRDPFALWIGGHNMAAVERAARIGTGWLPGWRPWPELAERIRQLKARAAELGRDPAAIEIAPQFSLTIAKTAEEAERRYMASGLVAHRKSLAYTGRDLSQQVVANLVGSPDLIREKVEGLKKIGVDHACALMIPADSMAEFEDQVEWFAKTVL
ncbi:probable F420-dependent oxidoreductase, Rv2161c family [Enhydrobacter aerosaccus]|uniref:Probable F420-dependent oxidoreductase, Rv2161c family n=1 Tax=Enhydrobacter aerosaccus TaxID=225324 RepID=A0A1T4P0N1_9HYPH|nr:TIGR03619 family F420-dependent LLM class oxidoreductase [Enhydrobacter aerosaccus]SJZ85114.1 probable F420-dependent oxidoreductase, Rv2161c family [Enhydrobacter aerosaccus]